MEDSENGGKGDMQGTESNRCVSAKREKKKKREIL
jgi:hypothetical protein